MAYENLKAIVLVGGLGTRLRPITHTVPKQLISIAGQPVLYHVFDMMPRAVKEITIACGYKADYVINYIKEHPYRIPIKVVREETQLGTAGAMLNAVSGASDPVVVVNGDLISGVDMEAMLKQHEERKAYGTMSLIEVEDPSAYGVAALDNDDRIMEFVEKPKREDAPSRWVNAGASIWSKDVFNAIPSGREVSFEREILPKLLEKPIYGFKFNAFWEDAGTPERMLNSQKIVFDNKKVPRFADVEGAKIIPPVAVGRNCKASGASIGEYVTIGDNVTIGNNCIIEDSIVLDDVTIGENSVVLHSIVGKGTVIPSNTRLDSKCIANEGK